MRRWTPWVVGSILAGTAVLALALEGKRGYTATELFVWGDAREAIVYEPDFDGAAYGDLPRSMMTLDRYETGHMWADAEGVLFLLVYGGDAVYPDPTRMQYSSLLRYDGTSLTHLLQAAHDGDSYGDGSNMPSGARIRGMTVSPVTHGRLTAGHPIVSWWTRDLATQAVAMELLSVDPDSGATTVIDAWTDGDDGPDYMAPDANGTIHILMYSDEIHQLTWNGATEAYDHSVLDTSFTPGHLWRVGPDGALYTGVGNQSWQHTSSDRRQIMRIEPSTGAASVFAEVPARLRLCDLVFDSAGTAWIGLVDRRDNTFVTEVVPGELVSTRDDIATASHPPKGLAAGPDGMLYVHEAPMWSVAGGDYPHDVLSLLTPGEDDGGGKGGGKGKNK